jgi:methylthioribose-1-phosphate isomerase
MKVNGQLYRCIWLEDDGRTVGIIDQTKLPHLFETVSLTTVDDAVTAIGDMLVRGAPLIGATAAYGVCVGLIEDGSDKMLEAVCDKLIQARPTAVNLRWAVERMRAAITDLPVEQRLDAAYSEAADICNEDVQVNESLGEHGLALIQEQYQRTGQPVNILTHCNAGWLAFVDYGSATAPIYRAHQEGIPLHVWVDETRPWNQGAKLTAWELFQENIDHTLIVDNTGGHLMQHGLVDLVIVGSDRTTRTGDVANKIGTYLKALAAKDNKVPFYVALPSSTIDWDLRDGLQEIPIEKRSGDEVKFISGLSTKDNSLTTVLCGLPETPAVNYGFDVTPARLVSGIITERGIAEPNEKSLLSLFPEYS